MKKLTAAENEKAYRAEIARHQGLLIEQCADGTYRWESIGGSGGGCADEEECWREFLDSLPQALTLACRIGMFLMKGGNFWTLSRRHSPDSPPVRKGPSTGDRS